MIGRDKHVDPNFVVDGIPRKPAWLLAAGAVPPFTDWLVQAAKTSCRVDGMTSAILRVALVVVCLAGSQSALAQGRPVPSPELKKLDYFVGPSSSEGVMTFGPTSGKFIAKDKSAWTNGGFFVENRSEFTTPFGPGTLLEVLGYDTAKKIYTHDSYTSGGQRISSTGTVDGSVWTWTTVDGKTRHIVTVLSPTSFTFKTEFTQDGKTWTTMVEGTTTKG